MLITSCKNQIEFAPLRSRNKIDANLELEDQSQEQQRDDEEETGKNISKIFSDYFIETVGRRIKGMWVIALRKCFQNFYSWGSTCNGTNGTRPLACLSLSSVLLWIRFRAFDLFADFCQSCTTSE